jgi:hypothetical protein
MNRGKLRLRQVVMATAVTLGLVGVAVAPASADSTDTVGLPDGTVVQLEKPFADYTFDELAKLGIAPGQHGIIPLVATAAEVRGVQPMSSHGCSGRVCITLIGSGLTLDSWTTTLSANSTSTSWAEFWVGGSLRGMGSAFTAQSGYLYGSAYTGSLTFSNGDRLCNAWGGFSGRPCETVHS